MWIFWPFKMIWLLVSTVFKLVGRLLAIIIGLTLLIFGTLLSLTGIGLIIGLPLAIFGFLLLLKGLF